MKQKPLQGPHGADVVLLADPEALSRTAADLFVRAALQRVESAGRFVVALSGGSTPRGLYALLAQAPYTTSVPWERVHFFWVDERHVPWTHRLSNFGAAGRDLFDHRGLPRENLHPMPVEGAPEDDAASYEKTLVNFFGLGKGQFPLFDFILLGVGRDGHTASLFPDQASLKEGKKRVVNVQGGVPPLERLTLTLPVLNRGRRILFLVSGNAKAGVLRKIFEGPAELLPAGLVEPMGGRAVWLIDRAAAARL